MQDEVDEGCDEIDEEDDALCSMAFPMALIVLTVSSARPPKVSATTGTKSTPADLQAAKCEASLR